MLPCEFNALTVARKKDETPIDSIRRTFLCILDHQILTTFSPCSDGTESRNEVKLSFMWSLRFRSNALWCARFSA